MSSKKINPGTLIIFALILLVFFSIQIYGQQAFKASVLLSQNIIRNCGTVTETADLIQNINTSSNCLNFSANNIILNCASYNITGNQTGTAINITNRNNITITNCKIINFTIGIHGRNSTNLEIGGIDFEQTGIETEFFGSAQSYTQTNLSNQSIASTSSNLTINSSQVSNTNITVINGQKTEFLHSTITNSIINITNTTQILLTNTTTSNTTFTTTTTTTTTTLSNISFTNNSRITSIGGYLQISDSFISEYNLSNTNLSIARTNTGEINFTMPITGASTTDIGSQIIITNESIKINSITTTHFNTTARLTFFPQSFTDIEPKIDPEDDGTFTTCPTDICQNTATSSNTFIFDVTHFTSFGFGPSPGSPSPGGVSAAAGGKGGGPSSKQKTTIEFQVVPEYLETFVAAGETKNFMIEVRNGAQKTDMNILLEGAEFMTLNNQQRELSLTLPPSEVWRMQLTATLPKSAKGIYLGTIKIKGVNLEKIINIRIVAISRIQEDKETIEEKNLTSKASSKATIEKPYRLKRVFAMPTSKTIQQIKTLPFITKNIIFGLTILFVLIALKIFSGNKFKEIWRMIKLRTGAKKHQRHMQRHKPLTHKHSEKEPQLQLYIQPQPPTLQHSSTNSSQQTDLGIQLLPPPKKLPPQITQ